MALDSVVFDIFGPPPEGIDLSETYSPAANAIAIISAGIAGLSVLSRFTSRYLQNASYEADDYLMVFSLVGS